MLATRLPRDSFYRDSLDLRMPQSIVKILVHIVFSTKNRANLITPEIEPELFAYISGIIKNNGARLIIGGGPATNVN